MRLVRFPVSFSLLEQVLELPNGTYIVGIEQDGADLQCHLLVGGPDFPEGVTDCEPVVTERRRSWDWRLD